MSVIQIEKKVLAAPMDEIYCRTVEPPRKFGGRRIRSEPLSAQFRRTNAAVSDEFVERSGDDLDFRQFRHATLF